MRPLPAFLAVAAVTLTGPAPARAAAHPEPTVKCARGDVYDTAPYVGIAVTTDPPLHLTLTCRLDNGWDRFSTTARTDAPVAVLAFAGITTHPDSMHICATAVAEYADATVTTGYCN